MNSENTSSSQEKPAKSRLFLFLLILHLVVITGLTLGARDAGDFVRNLKDMSNYREKRRQAEPLTLDNARLLAEARKIMDRGSRFILSQLKPNGLFQYSYDYRRNRYSSSNNALRQMMVSRFVAELCAQSKPTEQNPASPGPACQAHKRNLDFLFKHWYKTEGNHGYFYYNKKSKLGANAMGLRTMVHSPYFNNYAQQAEAVYQSMASMFDPENGFASFYKKPAGYKYSNKRLEYFYSGEALLAMVEYYERVKRPDILELCRKIAAHYRIKYIEQMNKNYYPAYVPWHTVALYKLHRYEPRQEYVDSILTWNKRLLQIHDTKFEVGRFYKKEFRRYGKPHSSSDGIYTEGLVYAWDIARRSGHQAEAKTFRRAIGLAVYNLKTLQVKSGDVTGTKARRDKIVGAIRTVKDRLSWRIDNTQHSYDGLSKLVELLEKEPG